MARQLGCRDVGVDCSWSATADTDEDLLKIVLEHARDGHGLDPVPAERLAAIKAAMHDA